MIRVSRGWISSKEVHIVKYIRVNTSYIFKLTTTLVIFFLDKSQCEDPEDMPNTDRQTDRQTPNKSVIFVYVRLSRTSTTKIRLEPTHALPTVNGRTKSLSIKENISLILKRSTFSQIFFVTSLITFDVVLL